MSFLFITQNMYFVLLVIKFRQRFAIRDSLIRSLGNLQLENFRPNDYTVSIVFYLWGRCLVLKTKKKASPTSLQVFVHAKDIIASLHQDTVIISLIRAIRIVRVSQVTKAIHQNTQKRQYLASSNRHLTAYAYFNNEWICVFIRNTFWCQSGCCCFFLHVSQH